MVTAMIQKCLATIAAAPDARALADSWQRFPVQLQAPLLATIEEFIAHLDKTGEAHMANSFREKLAVLSSLKAS